ncbi:1158_t:CDS:10 [Diversispora eburnea]|uniref:FACT complex subunit POB3 n=1 Tax=Diversispora eburnea TaxID=1213867 RepID=A0A9N9FVE1_9GLOM|nr:1158_t:CDS:10 [Diversispora eburnea]
MGDPKSKQFENIYYGLSNYPGILKLAPSGLGWKTADSENIVTISADEFKKIQWMRVARDYQLKVALKNGSAARFDGFVKDNFESLREIIRTNYKLNLETKELSVRGWNWGKTDFQVSNTNLQNKVEVSLEFMQPEQLGEDAKVRSRKAPVHELVEMRFYVPGSTVLFFETVKEKADLTQVSGEGIVLFQDVLLLTPRGRYDIEMFPTFFRLRGKTYDYKIQQTSVVSLFLLPKLDDLHEMFVGQTLYHFLVLQFKKEEEREFQLNLDDETVQKEYGGKLELQYEAPVFEVFSTVFHVLTKKKIIRPSGFQSQHDEVAVKCSLKANEGYLYPLEKCFLFIPKPPTLIKTSDIEKVIFSRVSMVAGKTAHLTSARTFDVKFSMKSGLEYQFSILDDYADVFSNNSDDEPHQDGRIVAEDSDTDSDSDVAEEYDENYAGIGSSTDGEDKGVPKKKVKISKTKKPKS